MQAFLISWSVLALAELRRPILHVGWLTPSCQPSIEPKHLNYALGTSLYVRVQLSYFALLKYTFSIGFFFIGKSGFSDTLGWEGLFQISENMDD